MPLEDSPCKCMDDRRRLNLRSAGRTRIYNQWINGHAQTVQLVSMGVGMCRSVYFFEP